MIPPEIRAAIALVGFVVCEARCGPVELAPDEERECARICHPFADCPHVLHPDSAAAMELARSVDEEIGRYAQLGDYCEPEPVHAWGMP